MYRNFILTLLALSLASGCSEREPAPAIANATIGAGGAAMAVPVPKFNALLVSDQATFKAAPSPAADANFNALLTALPKPKSDDAAAEESTEGGDEAEAGSKGGASSLLKGLKSLLPGGKKAAATDGESTDAPADDEGKDITEMLRDAPRPEVTSVPPNPADRPSQGIELARKSGAMAATQALMLQAMQLPMDDGDGTLLGAAVVKEVKNPKAISAENLNATGIRIVGMKWIDADTLEVEVEISIGDLATAVAKIAPNLSLDSIRTLGEDKCLAATGKGVIPPGMRTGNKAAPGQRARDAAEGGF